MEEFKKCVLDLFTNHDMNKREICKLVKATIIEHVNHLPKDRVLYNAKHGGFSFSKEFCSFCKTLFFEYDRVEPVPYILPFADHVLTTIPPPYMSSVLAVRAAYPIEQVFSNLWQITMFEEYIANIHTNIDIIRKYLGNNPESLPDALDVSCERIFLETSVIDDIYKYNVETLTTLLERYDQCPDKFLASNREYVQKAKAEMAGLLPEEVTQDMFEYIHIYKKREISSMRGHNDYFIELLKTKGAVAADTWESQSYYKPISMLYLISLAEKGKLIDVFPEAAGLSDADKETWGLLCASGKYAKLLIAEVPAGVDWEISEYDGLERIVI